MAIDSLMKHMERIPDSRCGGKIHHKQAEILTCLVAALVAGKTSLRRCMVWIRAKERWLRKQKGMKLANGIPSLSTVSRILSGIDEEQFIYHFAQWAYEMNQLFLNGLDEQERRRPHIVIDGKCLKGSGSDVVPGSRTPLVLNAVCATTGLVLAQYPIRDKSCELNELPNILKMLDLEGCIVTIDAAGTHASIMNQIVEAGGHFLMQVKNNQPNALKDIKRIFEKFDNNHTMYSWHEPYPEKNRDRFEYRSCKASTNLDELRSMEEWPVRSYSLLEQLRIMIVRDGNGENITPGREDFLKNGSPRQAAPCRGEDKENDYQEIGLVSDEELKACEFLEIKRKHWFIENSLHNVLDQSFHEDKSTATKSRNNLSLLRKIGFNLLKLIEREVKDTGCKTVGELMDYVDANPKLMTKYVFHPIVSN